MVSDTGPRSTSRGRFSTIPSHLPTTIWMSDTVTISEVVNSWLTQPKLSAHTRAMDREISVGFIVSSRERPEQPVERDEFCRLLIASRSEMSLVDFVDR